MKDLPKSERPRERLAKLGAETLSMQELLAIIIGTGNSKKNVVQVASQLLQHFEGNLENLFSATIAELTEVRGVGFAKACQIKAVFEIVKRVSAFCEQEPPVIHSTEDIATMLMPHLMYLKQEEFHVVLLDSKHKVIKVEKVSMGSLDIAFVHPRDVFRPAVKHSAASIILVHNHPSGDPQPSEQDIVLTRELRMCGNIMDIEVIDHVIIGHADYVSLKHRDLM
jgi:DNA repair protein RadC